MCATMVFNVTVLCLDIVDISKEKQADFLYNTKVNTTY